jgi:hypothetical protein
VGEQQPTPRLQGRLVEFVGHASRIPEIFDCAIIIATVIDKPVFAGVRFLLQPAIGDTRGGPSHGHYQTQGAFRFDFSNGKIRSILSYWDTAAMARQLGLVG